MPILGPMRSSAKGTMIGERDLEAATPKDNKSPPSEEGGGGGGDWGAGAGGDGTPMPAVDGVTPKLRRSRSSARIVGAADGVEVKGATAVGGGLPVPPAPPPNPPTALPPCVPLVGVTQSSHSDDAGAAAAVAADEAAVAFILADVDPELEGPSHISNSPAAAAAAVEEAEEGPMGMLPLTLLVVCECEPEGVRRLDAERKLAFLKADRYAAVPSSSSSPSSSTVGSLAAGGGTKAEKRLSGRAPRADTSS